MVWERAFSLPFCGALGRISAVGTLARRWLAEIRCVFNLYLPCHTSHKGSSFCTYFKCSCCVVLKGAIFQQAKSLSNFIKSHIIYGEQFLTELISWSGIDFLSDWFHPSESGMIAPSLGTGQV